MRVCVRARAVCVVKARPPDDDVVILVVPMKILPHEVPRVCNLKPPTTTGAYAYGDSNVV